jgi:ABC-type transporter Mla subunit MlaD
MNTGTIRNALLTTIVVLFLIYIFIPSSRPYFSYLVVIGFVGLTIQLTWDGIRKKKKLNNQITNLEDILKSEIQSFYDNHPNKYEQINRGALIDEKCAKNQEFRNWEKQKLYYQSLPNFLLSIGLIGTFTGITMNLALIAFNTRGVIEIQSIIPDIIFSMSIAFISSLVALASSSFLVKFYPTSDLETQKDNLLTSLEHYIDNEVLINQSSKIDQLIESIDNYSQTLTTFLSSLKRNTETFENAITNATNKINTSANNFQSIVNQSSQTMQTGANVLSNVTNNIATLSTQFSDLTSSLSTSATSFEKSTSALQNHGKNLQQVTDSLLNNSEVVENLSQNNTERINNLSETLVNNSNQVQNLIQNNHKNLESLLQQLFQTSQNISTSTQSLQNNVNQVVSSLNQHSSQIGNYNNNLQELSGVITNATQSSNANLPELANMLGNQVNQLQTIATQFNQNTKMMEQINHNLAILSRANQNNQQSQN